MIELWFSSALAFIPLLLNRSVRREKGIMKKIDLGSWVQIGILIVMAIGLGFTIGYNLRSEKIKALETQIETFGFAEKSDLNKLLVSLQMASEQLKDSLILSEDNQKLRKELAIASDQNKEIIAENNDLKSKFEYLESLVNIKYGDTDKFRLKSRVTKYLFGNKIILTWKHSSFISGIDLKLNNITKNLNVGDFIEFKANGDTYKLIFDSIDNKTNEAIFIYSK